MCCSVSPRQHVHFSGTVLYGAEVQRPDGTWVHVLGYQNQVGRPGAGRRTPPLVRPARGPNDTDPDMIVPAALAPTPAASVPPEERKPSLWSRLFGRKAPTAESGNAMLLAIPARSGSMTSKNVVDTSTCIDVFDGYVEAVAPSMPVAAGRMIASSGPPRAPRVEVFDAAGIYTVVLADAAAAIPGALSRVPDNKRPALNPALFDAYARWYPGWTFALCCFDSREAGKAHPLVWWYEPLDENRLILPALDCHTGDVPNLNARVTIDHVIAVGSTRMSNRAASSARHVHLGKLPTAAQPFFVNRVVGERLDRDRTTSLKRETS